MKDRLIQNGISVRRSPIHGYGVFAEKPINKGEIVEECRTLFSDGTDKGLNGYYFDADNDQIAYFLTGYGVLYNHSDQPNVTYDFDRNRQVTQFKATQFIRPGEELFISYGDDYFDTPSMQHKEATKQRRWITPMGSLLIRGLFICAAVFASAHFFAWLCQR